MLKSLHRIKNGYIFVPTNKLKHKKMSNQIKLTQNLSLNGKITNLSINDNELIIKSNSPITWSSAESVAKYLIKKGYNKIEKITFKELH